MQLCIVGNKPNKDRTKKRKQQNINSEIYCGKGTLSGLVYPSSTHQKIFLLAIHVGGADGVMGPVLLTNVFLALRANMQSITMKSSQD